MRHDIVAILINKASLELKKQSNPEMQKFNLTGSQYRIIKYLFALPPGTVRQVDLEKYYSMTHPTAIGLLDQLEMKGFIHRTVNPDDKRSRIIHLTEKAYEMQEAINESGDRIERGFTSNLTDRERKRLIALLQKLLRLDARSTQG